MRFSTTAAALRDVLNRARQVVPATPSMVAYSGILLKVEETLEVVASDGETSLSVFLPVEVGSPGQVLIAPKPVLAFLGSLTASDSVTVELEQGDLRITPDGVPAYTFRPLSATFPAPQRVSGGVRPEGLDRFLPALTAVRSASGRETSAVQLVSDADQLVLYTTDGFRLARAVLPGAGFSTFTGVFSLPMLERLARANPAEVALDVKDRSVTFRGDDFVMTLRLLAIPFPPVETVLLAAPPTVTTLRARDLARALARLSAVAEQGTVSLVFEGSSLLLRAAAAEIGAGEETVELLAPVPARFAIQLRAPYLQDSATALGEETVSVAYSGELQPLYLSVREPIEVTHVVMPVRG